MKGMSEGDSGDSTLSLMTIQQQQSSTPLRATRKRRWGPPLPLEQVDLRKKEARRQQQLIPPEKKIHL